MWEAGYAQFEYRTGRIFGPHMAGLNAKGLSEVNNIYILLNDQHMSSTL